MPSYCGYSWDDNIEAVLAAAVAEYNIIPEFLYGTIAVESAFDPLACGDHKSGGNIITGPDGHKGMVIHDASSPVGFYVAWECGRTPGTYGGAHGLLQLSTFGGQGNGYTWSQLTDPSFNLDIGSTPIAFAINHCQNASTFADVVCCFGRTSGHPGWVSDCNDSRIQALLSAINCFATQFHNASVSDFFDLLGCLFSGTVLPVELVARWAWSRGRARMGRAHRGLWVPGPPAKAPGG